MRKADAIAHFGTQQKLARALGRSQSTIAEWPEAVPLESAFILERLTKRRLKIDFKLYPKVPQSVRDGGGA